MTSRQSLSPMRRLAIFERAKGRCHICTRKIRAGEPWDVSHDRPLGLLGEDGGDNLKVAHRSCHGEQTKIDQGRIAKAKRRAAKHFGIRKRSSFPCGKDSKWKRKVGGGTVLREAR